MGTLLANLIDSGLNVLPYMHVDLAFNHSTDPYIQCTCDVLQLLTCVCVYNDLCLGTCITMYNIYTYTCIYIQVYIRVLSKCMLRSPKAEYMDLYNRRQKTCRLHPKQTDNWQR